MRKSDLADPPGHWIFTRVPTDRDYHRFHNIARRVYTLEDIGDLPLGKSVFDAISNGLPESPVLFPNLHSARFIPRDEPDPVFMRNAIRLLLLFPSSVRQLSLSTDPRSNESCATLLRSVASHFSKLSSITVYRVALTQREREAMVELLEHNNDLHHAAIHLPIRSVVVDALSKLPHLESLEMGTDHLLRDSQDCQRCLQQGSFPRLKSLTIRFARDPTILALLTKIGAHHSLQTLRMVSHCNGFEQSDLDASVDAVIKHRFLHHLSLRYLLIPISRASALQAIAACAILESLEIDVRTTYSTLPDDLQHASGRPTYYRQSCGQLVTTSAPSHRAHAELC
ncbi:hypothetical protein FRB95_003071 [Tulasnella sp. JGI-2019a]|nr:hypothetical protein FRB95_003071 [Tulasnella sp. JGI-2019a]